MDPRILEQLRAQKSLIVKGLVCSGASALLLAATAWFVKFVLHAVEQGQPHMLLWLSGAVVVLFAVKYWFTRGQTLFLGMAAARLTARLRLRLFEKLQRLPISFHNERRAGAIQSVLTNDVNVYQTAITVVRDAIDGPIKVVAGCVTIFVLQWQLALAAMLVLPLMAAAIQRNSRKMRHVQGEVQQDLAHLTATMHESLQGIRTIQAFGAERRATQRFRDLVERSFRSQVRAARRIATLRPMVELIGALALALVVLLCGRLVAAGTLTVADLGAFIMALDVINQGAKNLGSLGQTMAQVTAAADRIHAEVLDVPEGRTDAPNARELPDLEGRIEFQDVRFTYPDGTEALRGVSFTIEPGESLALVGPSGSGKSTLADLLLRFYEPTAGTILVDGVDVREVSTSALRNRIGVVPQHTFLFAGSIADNIRLGSPDASDVELEEAARAAHADGFIAKMPRRYETELGERGVRLSGGEQQRVAIARAVVRRPKILVLDEATSSLDAHSEQAVQEALDEVMKGRTTLLIAHRLTTAARANRIVVLRQGEVLEAGTHRELVARDGAYAAMYRAFVGGVLDGAIG